ncbi:MAG: hypothetical protein ABSC89_15015 [Verrucomicrobiota bacterium]
MFALLALGLMVAVSRLEAQGVGLLLGASANSIGVSNTLTYTVIVTNLTGASQTFTVTNTLTGTSLQFSTPPTATQGSNVISGSNVVFALGAIATNGTALMTVPVVPISNGFVTNTVLVATNGVFAVGEYIFVQVTNTALGADVAVAIAGPASAVFTNDWMVYGVNVTNLGPGTVSGVFLTNTLPTGVGYIGVSPSSPAPSRVGRNVIFNLGTLTNGAFRNFLLTVQPTNAGVLPFVSVVSTNNSVFDPIPANNLASNNITVLSYFPGQLTAVTNSAQVYNSQNGLVEQSILVSNVGTNPVAAVRVVVTGLTNQLFNAVGTNNGSPFVVYAATLDTNQIVNLLLQFFAMNYFQLSNSQLHAFAVSVPNLTPPAAAAVSTNVNITRIIKLTNGSPLIIGSMLIEFPSLTNRTYTVVYNNDLSSTNWLIAPPSIIAPANRTQWIDYGPPTTVSAPPNSSNRFYRVFLNP